MSLLCNYWTIPTPIATRLDIGPHKPNALWAKPYAADRMQWPCGFPSTSHYGIHGQLPVCKGWANFFKAQAPRRSV